MFSSDTDEYEMYKTFMLLPNKNTTHDDDQSNFLLRKLATVVKGPLTIYFQQITE